MSDNPRPRSRRPAALAESLEARVVMTAVPLDPSFGDAGIVHQELPGRSNEHAHALVLDAAGNAIVGGVTGGAMAHGAALARYRPDGSLDPTFGEGGTTVWRPAGRSSSVLALGLQRDGRIITAGYAHSAGPEWYSGPFTLARFNRDGSPDPSFGESGAAVFPTLGQVRGLVVDASDRIVVATQRPFGPESVESQDFTVARFTPDGRLDPSFDADGIVTADFAGGADSVGGVALAPGGKIVVGGGATVTVSNVRTAGPAAARFNADGSPDVTFGPGGPDGDGKFTYTDPTFIRRPGATAVAVDAAGRVVLTAGPVVYRLTADGALDAGFGIGGGVAGAGGSHGAIALRPDGGIVVAGVIDSPPDTGPQMLVRRLSPGGTLLGERILDFWSPAMLVGADYASAVALTPDGKVVVAGSATADYQGANFAVARFHDDLAPDTSFSGDGRTMTDFIVPERAESRGVAVRPDGKFVVAAYSDGQQFAVLRYHPDGSPDLGFGAGGLASLPLPDPHAAAADVYDIAFAPGGKTLVAGAYGSDLAVARYNDDGSPDLSFGTGGWARVDVPVLPEGAFQERALAVVAMPDGGVALGGLDGNDLALARLTPDGRLDPSFGNNGIVTWRRVSTVGARIYDMAVDAQGRIVAAGPGLMRFLPDGQFDPSFAGDGILEGRDWHGVAMAPGGRILAISGVSLDTTRVARFHADGTPDASFGTNGAVDVTNPEVAGGLLSSAAFRWMSVAPDGSVALAGDAAAGGPPVGFVAAALDPDGRLRRDFGDGGLVVGRTLTASGGVAWTPDGAVLLAGGGVRVVRLLTGAAVEGRVVGRHVFYNRSRFDGGDAGAGAADDSAIARDKTALLAGGPAAASFNNVTSYARGINGVMFDVAGLRQGAPLAAADFVVDQGPGGFLSPWYTAATPHRVAVRRSAGAGAGGSDRVTLIWTDHRAAAGFAATAVANGWLRVTVLPNARTGLSAAHTFHFGNLIGETGDASSPLRVAASDWAGTRRRFTPAASISNRFDFNRDGRVSVLDLVTAGANQGRSIVAPYLPPVAAAPPPGRPPPGRRSADYVLDPPASA